MATTATSSLSFTRLPHPSPLAAQVRDGILANPGFGTHFTDYMVSAEWKDGQGWHNAAVKPYGPLQLDPATAVLHYAQEIFEGLKAYRQQDGGVALFRPLANAARFRQSAQRLAMPEIPDDLFLESVKHVVHSNMEWFPTVSDGALYIRPFMFASEAFLGVRPAKQYQYLVIASPVGSYFKSGNPVVSIWVATDYTRAAPGGTGAAKCGGNYAASLVPQARAIERGHDQVVFLDAVEHRWVEELGGMNMFFVFDDKTLLTPPLSGTILPGITRNSILALAREEGLTVREDRYSMDAWREDAKSGRLAECFACGTAAVITPVGKVASKDGEFSIGNGSAGELTQKLKSRLVAIQHGEEPDPHGWMMKIS